MKAVVAAFNQEKALVGAFSVITNLRMELFEALVGCRCLTLFVLSDCGLQVRVAVSRIPGAGEGLFVTRAVGRGELVAFYSGFVLTCRTAASHRLLDRRIDTDKERFHLNHIHLIK